MLHEFFNKWDGAWKFVIAAAVVLFLLFGFNWVT